MYLKLNNLYNFFINKRDEHPTDNLFVTVETIDLFSIDKEVYNFNVKYFKAENKNRINLFITEENKLVLNVVLDSSDDDLSDKYEIIKQDMINLSIVDFIDKYYELILKKNFQ